MHQVEAYRIINKLSEVLPKKTKGGVNSRILTRNLQLQTLSRRGYFASRSSSMNEWMIQSFNHCFYQSASTSEGAPLLWLSPTYLNTREIAYPLPLTAVYSRMLVKYSYQKRRHQSQNEASRSSTRCWQNTFALRAKKSLSMGLLLPSARAGCTTFSMFFKLGWNQDIFMKTGDQTPVPSPYLWKITMK